MKDVRHLVAALSAADVDDDVGIAVFRQGLLEHGLARSETSRHGDRSTFRDRKEEIENPLSGEEGPVRLDSGRGRPRSANGPPLHHRDRITRVEIDDCIGDGHVPRAYRPHLPRPARRDQDAQDERSALGDRPENVARLHAIARGARWRKEKTSVAIQRGCARTCVNEWACLLGEPAKRPSDAIDDAAEQARTKLDGQRQSFPDDWLADAHAGRLFEHLERGRLSSDPQYFAEQTPVADANQLVERRVPQPFGFGQRAHDTRQSAVHGCHRGFTR
jgi:hypothetical protein